MCVCACVGQKTVCGHQFSPCTVCVLGIEVRWSGMVQAEPSHWTALRICLSLMIDDVDYLACLST